MTILVHVTTHTYAYHEPFVIARGAIDRATIIEIYLTDKHGRVGRGEGHGVTYRGEDADKPDPAHLIEAVDAVGGDLTRTVMVGDSDTDAGAARAAGVPLILVNFGYTEISADELAPDILLYHFDDLANACTKLLGSAKYVLT